LDVRFTLPLVRDTILAARLARVFASLTKSNSLLQDESFLLSVQTDGREGFFLDSAAVESMFFALFF